MHKQQCRIMLQTSNKQIKSNKKAKLTATKVRETQQGRLTVSN